MKKSRVFAFFTALALTAGLLALPASAAQGEDFVSYACDPSVSAGGSAVLAGMHVEAGAAILVDVDYGQVLYAQNAHAKMYPASITKIMTTLLTLEAVDQGQLSLEQVVTASENLHAGIGEGASNADIRAGEQMRIIDLLYSAMLPSANEACNILAEAVSGSVSSFVALMNQRAEMLGMEDTHFSNTHGYHDDDHYTSAYDIALMSRELILNHPTIREFTTIWMDTLRDGTFQLSNTNRLIFYYEGATGLKTGFTDTALYCLSATAERDGMELIAVVMHAPTSNDRFESCKTLLNYGFANYAIIPVYPDQAIPPVEVLLGAQDTVQPVAARECSILLEKSKTGTATTQLEVAQQVEAPVEPGQKLGELRVLVDGQQVDAIDLIAAQEVPRLSIGGIFKRMLDSLFLQHG